MQAVQAVLELQHQNQQPPQRAAAKPGPPPQRREEDDAYGLLAALIKVRACYSCTQAGEHMKQLSTLRQPPTASQEWQLLVDRADQLSAHLDSQQQQQQQQPPAQQSSSGSAPPSSTTSGAGHPAAATSSSSSRAAAPPAPRGEAQVAGPHGCSRRAAAPFKLQRAVLAHF